MDVINLYKKDSTGAVRVWSIAKTSDTSYTMVHGVYGGSTVEKTEHVLEGKAGRTISEQILLRMASRISDKKAAGYSTSIEEALASGGQNELKLPLPMLAKPLKNADLPDHFILQYKYDGNRCLVTKKNGEMIAYSRNGKIFKYINHILDAASGIPEGTVLDGELYHHGTPLQTLRSWIAKEQEQNSKVIYICYDMITSEPYLERAKRLFKLSLEYPIQMAPNVIITPKKLEEVNLMDRLKAAKQFGYEGLIARTVDGMYQVGKRSSDLVKIKSWEDEEFIIYDIIPSSDMWAILCVQDSNGGRQFRVSAPGTIPEKEYILQNKSMYIGSMVTVEYANLTNDSIPFHPVAIAIREHHE